MQCRRCGKELGGSARCSFCGYHNVEDGSVREMSAVERNNYRGITIDAQSQERFDQQFNFQSNFRAARPTDGFWTRLFGNHIVTRILVALVLVLMLAFTLFVALPLVVTVVGTILLWYFVKRVVLRR